MWMVKSVVWMWFLIIRCLCLICSTYCFYRCIEIMQFFHFNVAANLFSFVYEWAISHIPFFMRFEYSFVPNLITKLFLIFKKFMQGWYFLLNARYFCEVRKPACTINSKISGIPKGVYFPISKLATCYFNRSECIGNNNLWLYVLILLWASKFTWAKIECTFEMGK